MTLENNNLKWVAVQLKPNMLNKALKNLKQQSFEYLAPMRNETIRSGNIFKKIKKLLFPGYIFVKVDLETSDVTKINSTFGISRIVCFGSKKVGIIPDSFITDLKIIYKNTQIFKDRKLIPGDVVKWINGPFSGMLAKILKLDENGRLKILFQVLDDYRIISSDIKKIELA